MNYEGNLSGGQLIESSQKWPNYCHTLRVFRLAAYLCLFISLLFLIAGCAASHSYVEKVVESSEETEPSWVTTHKSGRFVGIGDDRSKRIARQNAEKEILAQIAREIGIELSVQSSFEKLETDAGISSRTNIKVKEFSNALIHDINTQITYSYWEHCRAKIGKRKYNDFYRYYVCADVQDGFINSLRQKTLRENERRKDLIETHLNTSRDLLSKPAIDINSAIRECVQALVLSTSLFYGRQSAIDEALFEMIDLLQSIQIIKISDYSEVRPEHHRIEYKVVYRGSPVAGAKIGFKLLKGNGFIPQSKFTDVEGIVSCNLNRITSQIADNRILTFFSIEEFLPLLDRISVMIQRNLIAEVERAAESCVKIDYFSTLAKTALVSCGSLRIAYVNWSYEGIFRRIDTLNAIFYINEHNGRSVTFDRYRAVVTVWYEVLEGFFQPTIKWDVREGTYSLRDPVILEYLSQKEVNLENLPAIAGLINELKAEHEIGMREVKIDIKLQGFDDAGNPQEATTSTDRMLWKSLLEK